MNEWEWQLLEDKTPVDSVAGRRRRSCGRAIASACARARAATCSTWRWRARPRSSKASSRTTKASPISRWCWTTIPAATWACCGSPAIASSSAPRKWSRSDGEEARPSSILIAGIGNIFLGDDAFGVEVANRLSKRDACRRRCAWSISAFAASIWPTRCWTATTSPSWWMRLRAADAPGTLYAHGDRWQRQALDEPSHGARRGHARDESDERAADWRRPWAASRRGSCWWAASRRRWARRKKDRWD